ncbi:MAG: beta-galactosidase [Robinsoniella sp.]|nr:beta-galactosidase [Robinsoniella sp.]
MEFKTQKLLHGGDYNPEQWLDRPDILEKDIEMMREAGCNTVSLGIFSWSILEPQEGIYHFEWLEEIIDRLYSRGISTILATPSGARPKWLADRYPEVLRVDGERRRQLFGFRHNHCYTSPIYREKTAMINKKLSEHFGSHPGVIMWHLSNELGGECHCPLCQEAFRGWLKEKYGTIEELNRRWSTTFWSHTYQSFDQIESPSPIGETQLHGLNLDWKRFVTHQTMDYLKNEIQALREGGSTLPVTTNLMYYFQQLDYFKLAKELDIVSWDTYPTWHKEAVMETAYDNGMCHDLMRSLKKKPFFQIESCPTSTNWQGVSKLKKPGVLFSQSMQAIAHGGEGAMYFQIRQSRGASEKFHGAVIDHYGEKDTRVFQEVAKTGKALRQISEIAGSEVKSQVAIVYDWDSQWAMEDSQGPRNKGLHYHEVLLKFYRGFRKLGYNVDFVDMDCEIGGYKVLALPMCYMFKEGFAQKVRTFVEHGGILINTYWSGIADETDRCYLGGTPHGLMDVLGARSMEIDGLYDWEENQMVPLEDNVLGLSETYQCKYLCDLLELRGAKPVMVYGSDFYQGYAALTVNAYGAGEAWYVAADAEQRFYEKFIERLMRHSRLTGVLDQEIPQGLEVTTRETDEFLYYIYQNFGTKPVKIPLPQGKVEVIHGEQDEELPVYEMVIVKKKKEDTENRHDA